MNEPEESRPDEVYKWDRADTISVCGCLVALAAFFILMFAGVIQP